MTAKKMLIGAVVLAIAAVAVSYVEAYCLTGVRWPASTKVYHNTSGKVSTGQCISSSQMDSAVQSGITAWKALSYGGTTTKRANRKDGQNTVGWANLGGSTLGITNYLSYDRYQTVECGSNLFANLYEADVRLTTQYRWTGGGGGCPCAAGSAIYLDSVSMHEHGHVIGLCHVSNASALMYPSTDVCDHKGKTQDENAGENALCY